MRRHVFMLLLCLLFGLFISLVLAWSGALWSRVAYVPETPPPYKSGWAQPSGGTWPQPNNLQRGWGLDVRRYWVEEQRRSVIWANPGGRIVEGPSGWEAQVGAAGWPWRCLEWEQRDRVNLSTANGGVSRVAFDDGGAVWRTGLDLLDARRQRGKVEFPRVLPLSVAWGGLASDVAFWGLGVGLLWEVVGHARRDARRRRGLCPICGYPVGVSDRCTECGARARSVG
jgi:hypothetical protein